MTPSRPEADRPDQNVPAACDPPSAPAPPAAGVLAVVGLLVFFELTSGFLQGSIAPLLPSLQGALDISSAHLHWVVAVQFLAAAVCVPVFGRLGDLYGHRRMLRISLAFIAVGAVVVAAAPNLAVLLAGRVLLGPLAALLPLEIGLVRDRLTPKQSRRAIGLLVGALTLGGLLGSLASGVVQTLVGDVRITLGLMAALAVGCFALSYTAIPESRNRASGRMDWAGGTLLGLSLIVLLGTISQANTWGWSSPALWCGFAVAVALFAWWVRVELRGTDPLVDVRAVVGPAVSPQYAAGFTLGLVMLGGQSVIVTYLASSPEAVGYGFGMDVLSLGLCVTLPGVAAFLGASTVAPVGTRIGYRRAVLLAFTLVAAGALGLVPAWDSLVPFLTSFAVLGLGCGLALGALPTLIVEASAEDRAGSATAVYNNLKTLGGSVGGAVFATVLGFLLIDGSEAPSLAAYQVVWALTAVTALATAVLAGRTPRSLRQRAPTG
ncbi:MFS transporter [Nocardiopsis sp. YSL2]|uniref:MFS transporter n=1 Tax=Nocardiopsis sp. YSL2 TaxID=2939492 RepID=UPI0026F40A3A|nr:MFS transporter [Nocardiopsis sp. YSL2]